MTRLIDRTGMKYGRLTLLRYVGSTPTHKKPSWVCKCDCGEEVTRFTSDIVTGNTTSCGCYRREVTAAKLRSHGLTDTPEYKTWCKIKERCHVPASINYSDYGGRGIEMCPTWVNSFETFLADMGNKPTSGHSVERLDVDGNYNKDNCCWATRKEQARNKRTTLYIEHLGCRVKFMDFCDAIHIKPQKAYQQIFRDGWTTDRVVENHRKNLFKGAILIDTPKLEFNQLEEVM